MLLRYPRNIHNNEKIISDYTAALDELEYKYLVAPIIANKSNQLNLYLASIFSSLHLNHKHPASSAHPHKENKA